MVGGAPVDFYFDFSSPYGYLAATQIDALAARHGRGVTWRPYLIGAAFKAAGTRPLTEIPMKGDYALHDWPRSARRLGVRFKMPATFPFLAVAASRAFYWLDGRDPELARRFAHAAYDAAFAEGGDISTIESVVAVVAKLGVDAGETRRALTDPAVKERLRVEVDAALARGVFGSPFFVVDGEPFWGSDRLDQVAQWLAGRW